MFHGIVAIGAALLAREENTWTVLQYNYQPRLPIIYLSNTDETHIIEEYIQHCVQATQDGKDSDQTADIDTDSQTNNNSNNNPNNNNNNILPSLWFVERNGHCNVNTQERYTTIEALLKWVNEGIAAPSFFNNTHTISAGKSQVFFDDEGGMYIMSYYYCYCYCSF